MGVGRGEKVILKIYFYAEGIPQHFFTQHFSKLLGIKNLRVKPLKIRILILIRIFRKRSAPFFGPFQVGKTEKLL